MMIPAMAPRALIFDVFGTCVDWRTSVSRAVYEVFPGLNQIAFADAWRAEYQPGMTSVREGNRVYTPLEILHFENLRRVCDRYGVPCPSRLNDVWEALTPWSDVVKGLSTLKRHAMIAPCSNGSIAMMTRLARYAGLPWDCILGADIARDYKPKPEVYQAACAALRLDPIEVMMVSAHNDDLSAARAAGLQTGFVPRPTEYGAEQTTDLKPLDDWDMVATDFNAMAWNLFHDGG